MERTINFTLRGETPLLMHRDDVMAADQVEAWIKDPANKGRSKAGDDRTPAWKWQTYLYHDGDRVTMPADNLMACLRAAAAGITLKGNTTYKKLSQAALVPDGDGHLAFTAGLKSDRLKPVAVGGFTLEADPRGFADQVKAAEAGGFKLNVKRAPIGSAKHVRVRPQFDFWQVTGTLTAVLPTEDVPDQVILDMFRIAGSRVGLGDWRPGSPRSPGTYGRFTTEVRIES